MGDIVNLNQFRKRRERELKDEQALGNHVKSGQTKADRKSLRHEAERRGDPPRDCAPHQLPLAWLPAGKGSRIRSGADCLRAIRRPLRIAER